MTGGRIDQIQEVGQIRHDPRVRLPDPGPALVDDVPGRGHRVPDVLASGLPVMPVDVTGEVTALELVRDLAGLGHGVSVGVLTPVVRALFRGRNFAPEPSRCKPETFVAMYVNERT